MQHFILVAAALTARIVIDVNSVTCGTSGGLRRDWWRRDWWRRGWWRRAGSVQSMTTGSAKDRSLK
jgi:hypothetical protein